MPHDCAEFGEAIGTIPFDLDWDSSDMVQAGYLRAGLKRYKVDYQNTLNAKSKTTSEKETAESSTYGNKSLNASASSPVDVKIELVAYAVLTAEMKVIQQGESKLGKECKILRSLKVDLEISKKVDAPARALQAASAIDAVEKAQHMLLTFLAVYRALPTDDEVQVENMAKQVKGRADEGSDVLDAAKQIVKRLQNFMQS